MAEHKTTEISFLEIQRQPINSISHGINAAADKPIETVRVNRNLEILAIDAKYCSTCSKPVA